MLRSGDLSEQGYAAAFLANDYDMKVTLSLGQYRESAAIP